MYATVDELRERIELLAELLAGLDASDWRRELIERDREVALAQLERTLAWGIVCQDVHGNKKIVYPLVTRR
jgi:hypothetical protein